MSLPLTPRTPSLGDFGAVGNLHTLALVSRFGSVDWACVPKFASPSVFARILDETRGGMFRIAPRDGGFGDQRYLPSTNILETRFPIDGRRWLYVTDFMPVASDRRGEERGLMVRIVEATGGPVDVRVDFEPRFAYGRFVAKFRPGDDGSWSASHGRERLELRMPVGAVVQGGQLAATAVVSPGRPFSAYLSWGDPPQRREPALDLLRRTETFWREWVHDPRAPLHRLAGHWHDLVERSELTLKLLSNAATGAFVAAPTTSLPEWPGGKRNWDYRFVWLRDAAFTAETMLLLSHYLEARRFLLWVIDRLKAGRRLKVVYGAHGETDLEERTLPHLNGLWGSRPVRVGNAAHQQFQLDIYGEILDAALLLARVDPRCVSTRFRHLMALADRVERLWTRPDRGIWEIRGPPAHYVHSKLMAWVALDRACRLAQLWGGDPRAERWRRTAQRVRDAILEHGWDERRGAFVQAFGSSELDAANLRIPIVGFLPYDDPRVVATVDRTAEELARGPWVYRYRADDGVGGAEGAFLPCSFWLVECLARSGRRDRALAHFEALREAAGPLGLFAEEFDPTSRSLLGNYPQAFSHIGLLRAALAIGYSVAPPVLREEVRRFLPVSSPLRLPTEKQRFIRHQRSRSRTSS